MTARTDIKLMNGFSALNWYYNEKQDEPSNSAPVAKFHGALVMFADIHGLNLEDIIDTLNNHNSSSGTKLYST